ncbi:unnamed protein product [Lactuca virosa]|uniref:Uncharacterized protein n=1 Tax=Lactuca virosa TaxID=75947 RepID=A0AAU9MM09_9ASTR|nr:unnamed protein product [Lactuca virosa]
MSRSDTVTDLSYPKPKRTVHGRDSKSHRLTNLSVEPSIEVVNPDSSLEPSPTVTLHDYLVTSDHELNHAEEALPIPDVNVSNVESPIVTVDPLPLGSSAPGSLNTTPLEVLDTSSMFGDDPHPNPSEAPLPNLVTFAALLPQFQREFATTTIPKSLELADASNEENLDRDRSCLMEGIHLLNKMSFHTRNHAILLAAKQLKFEEAFKALKGMRANHECLEEEARNLWEDISGLLERNTRLVDDLIEGLYCQDELKKLNQDRLIKTDVVGRRLELSKEFEEKSQQFESMKLRVTEKVSQLEIAFSDKDAHIKFLVEELAIHKATISEKETQIASLGELHTSTK